MASGRVEIDARRTRLVGYLVCVVGFGLTLVAFYPGLMSPDSIASLNEGRSGIIYDQNSPIMSYVWGRLDNLIPGPGLMLIFQLGIFWSAVATLWEVVSRESLALGFAFVLFPFLPHVLSQLPVIWKDVAMAITLFLAVALIYAAQERRSKAALLLSVVFLFLGASFRLNAFPAVLPIVVFATFVGASLFELQSTLRTRMLAAVACFAFILVSAYGAQWAVTGGRSSHPFQFVMLYDLSAISIADGTPMFPTYIADSENFSMESVARNYSTTSVGNLVYVGQAIDGPPPLTVVEDAEKIGDLRSTWLSSILAQPGPYLLHRAAVFAKLIGLSRSVSFQYWDLDLTKNPAEFTISKNVAGRILTGYFRLFQRPAMQTFFRGVIWIAVGIYLLYRGYRSGFAGDWAFVGVLVASSLLYMFSYFVVAPAADYRYIYWPAIASTVATIFGIYLIRNERRVKSA
jgi:hypothetical protein